MKKLFFSKTACIIALTILSGFLTCFCSFKASKQLMDMNSHARYRTNFPDSNVSADLENVLRSVKKIKNYSSYHTYVFDKNTRITLKDLSSEGLLEHTRAGIVTNEATAGTACVIFSDGTNTALLTCAHAVKAPDTIIQWAEYSDLGDNKYIHSISIKIKQQLYVNDLPEGNKFRVLASDLNNDIAFIGTRFTEPVPNIPVFSYKCGNSSELRWGSFLYLAGFPTGQQMVIHGIVSSLAGNEGSFLTDALFNEGLSGGMALAVTESGSQFELVGMARSVAATYGYVLKPEKEMHEFTYNPVLRYEGNIYVNQKKDISYGVTSIISINQIRNFYQENRFQLLKAGYNFDEFFELKPTKE